MSSSPFHKNLSELGWEEVKKRQTRRLPLADEWIELVGMQKGNSVLDIGPGPGVFTLRYAAAVGETGKVTALEKSEEAAAFLLEDLPQTIKNIEVVLGDAEEIALEGKGPFDRIMLTDILHHADSPSKILKNLYDNMQLKGTRILISEFDPESDGAFGPPLDKRLREMYLKNLLKKVGFTIMSSGKQLFEHYYIVCVKE